MKKMKLVLTALLMVLTITGISAKNANAAGEVAAWGENWGGQLGDGTWDNKSTPVQVLGLTGVTSVAGGGFHSLALKNDGTVWTWGGNWHGELGDGTWDNKSTPVQVSGLTGISAIAGGYFHSLTLKNDGTVWTWGGNWHGELGDGTWDNKSTPVQVLGLTGVPAIAGGDGHSLAIGRLAAYIEVQIDIKPGSYPNSIKLQDTGNIPVAIFGSNTFDIATIDVSSLQLNGTGVRIVKGKGYLSSYEDVNGDGFMDMVVQFDRGEVQLTAGDTSAMVTGKTSDGAGFHGSDSVRVIE